MIKRCIMILALQQEFNREPVVPIYSAQPDQVEKALRHVSNVAMNKLKGKELELLIAILPDNNGSLYGIVSLFLFCLYVCIFQNRINMAPVTIVGIFDVLVPVIRLLLCFF